MISKQALIRSSKAWIKEGEIQPSLPPLSKEFILMPWTRILLYLAIAVVLLMPLIAALMYK